jgi:uncharacterized sodium:solute symporter family permease YidK
MVTDAMLCFILLVMIGWIVYGCYATRPRAIQQRYQDRPRDHMDRAA